MTTTSQSEDSKGIIKQSSDSIRMSDGMNYYMVLTLCQVTMNCCFVYNTQTFIWFIFRVAPLYAFTMFKTAVTLSFYIFWAFVAPRT